jgi:mono/diheme cytochrome c family protein
VGFRAEIHVKPNSAPRSRKAEAAGRGLFHSGSIAVVAMSRQKLIGLRRTLALAVTMSLVGVAYAGTAADDTAKITAGETVYNTDCATCHGDDLVNTGQTFDLRALRADEWPRFENSVLNGKNQMPPWKGVLNVQQIDQLWHYIRAHAYQK